MRRLWVMSAGSRSLLPVVCSKRMAALVPLEMADGPQTVRPKNKLLPALKREGRAAAGQRPRHTLVLDLDETLVDSVIDGQATRCPQGFTALRPHAIPFLREMNELFEVVFWTGGTESYGRAVLNAIEACGHKLDGKPVVGPNYPNALFRHHTLEGLDYMKYLGHLNRDVTNCVIIDDNERSFWLTPRQAITCNPFTLAQDSCEKQSLGLSLRICGDTPLVFVDGPLSVPPNS